VIEVAEVSLALTENVEIAHCHGVLLPVMRRECRRIDRPHNHLDILRPLLFEKELAGTSIVVRALFMYEWGDLAQRRLH
jgi:hypothetical protein